MTRNIIATSMVGALMFAVLTVGILFISMDNSTDVEAVSVANQLYESGSYQEAKIIYEGLIAQGTADSSIYFNLGNTYFMQGDLGRAILNYQRAARLDPRDADIKTNLAVARSSTAELSTSEPVEPIKKVSTFSSAWLTLNETALLALSLWFGLVFLVLTFRQFQPGKIRALVQYGLVLTSFMALVTVATLGSRLYTERAQPEGVIVAPVVTVSSSPGEEYATEYRLFSGAEVNLLETRGDWAHLAGTGGDAFDGWIPLDTVETITKASHFAVPQF